MSNIENLKDLIIYQSQNNENISVEVLYKENMGLTTWKNSPDGRILKSDVMIAKNYLEEKQIKRLERTVTEWCTQKRNTTQKRKNAKEEMKNL